MTIAQFLDRVPWRQMRLTYYGQIRSLTGQCPICAVAGLSNERNGGAYGIAVEGLGLRKGPAQRIIGAADNLNIRRGDRTMRAEMIRRLRAARP